MPTTSSPRLHPEDLAELAALVADAVAARMAATTPQDQDPDALIDASEIARLVGYGRRHTAERIVKRPGFPAPVRVTPGGRCRWRRSDVLAHLNQPTKTTRKGTAL